METRNLTAMALAAAVASGTSTRTPSCDGVRIIEAAGLKAKD